MSTLDEITKEKQRVSEALARVDAQREKLTSQLSERPPGRSRWCIGYDEPRHSIGNGRHGLAVYPASL